MKQTNEYDSKVYSLVDNEDDSFYFFGCHALDARLPALIGRRVKITYKGKRSHAKGKTIRVFDILVWSEFEDDERDNKEDKAAKKKGKGSSKKKSKKSTHEDDVPF